MKNNNLVANLIRDIFLFNIKDIEQDLDNLWKRYQYILNNTRTLKDIEEARAYLYILGVFFTEQFGVDAIQRRLENLPFNLLLLGFFEVADKKKIPVKYNNNADFRKLVRYYNLLKKYKNIVKNNSYLDEDRFDQLKAKILKRSVKKIKVLKYKKIKVSDQKDIMGVVASSGIAKGKVKIILNERDFKKFKKGEILVAFTTYPSFVPLFKKANAVVTDIGGITSHAAIVARELKIPCIVGTKIATQVLKDGDLVEVDTNNQIVNVIRVVS